MVLCRHHHFTQSLSLHIVIWKYRSHQCNIGISHSTVITDKTTEKVHAHTSTFSRAGLDNLYQAFLFLLQGLNAFLFHLTPYYSYCSIHKLVTCCAHQPPSLLEQTVENRWQYSIYTSLGVNTGSLKLAALLQWGLQEVNQISQHLQRNIYFCSNYLILYFRK